jgi:hypothetical protein
MFWFDVWLCQPLIFYFYAFRRSFDTDFIKKIISQTLLYLKLLQNHSYSTHEFSCTWLSLFVCFWQRSDVLPVESSGRSDTCASTGHLRCTETCLVRFGSAMKAWLLPQHFLLGRGRQFSLPHPTTSLLQNLLRMRITAKLLPVNVCWSDRIFSQVRIEKRFVGRHPISLFSSPCLRPYSVMI